MNVNREVLISLVIGCAGLWLRVGRTHTCIHADYDSAKPLKRALMKNPKMGGRAEVAHIHDSEGAACLTWQTGLSWPCRKERGCGGRHAPCACQSCSVFWWSYVKVGFALMEREGLQKKTNHERKLMVDVSLHWSIMLNHLMMPAWAITKSLVSQPVVCRNSSYM